MTGHHDLDGHDHDQGGHELHDHGHGGLGHVHAPANFGKAFAIGIGLNLAFVAVEAIYGVLGKLRGPPRGRRPQTSPTCLACVVAWVASVQAKRPDARATPTG